MFICVMITGVIIRGYNQQCRVMVGSVKFSDVITSNVLFSKY